MLFLLGQSIGALFARCRLLQCARHFNQIQTLAFRLQCVDTCSAHMYDYIAHARMCVCVCVHGVCACSCACVRLHVRVRVPVPVHVCECTRVLCSCARALGRMCVCARARALIRARMCVCVLVGRKSEYTRVRVCVAARVRMRARACVCVCEWKRAFPHVCACVFICVCVRLSVSCVYVMRCVLGGVGGGAAKTPVGPEDHRNFRISPTGVYSGVHQAIYKPRCGWGSTWRGRPKGGGGGRG